jgi:PAS domain S-box-containing protein
LQQQPAQPESRLSAAPPQKGAQRLRRLVFSLGALAVLSILAGTAFSLWRMHDEVIRLAEQHLLGMSRILAEETLRSTHAVNGVLLAAANAAQQAQSRDRLAPSMELHRHLREIIDQTPYVSALMLFDASGALVADTEEFPPRPVKYGDSELFRAHRDRREPQAKPSLPVVGRMAGERRIRVSRGLHDPDGRLLGVIAAVVDPAYFLGPQGLRELGPEGSVRLLRRDGVLLTAYPMAIAASTGNYRDSALISQGAGAGRELIHHAGTDGADWISAIRVIDDYPLVVSVTSSSEFILRTWYRSTLLFGALAAVTAVFLALITSSLAHQLRIDAELKSAVAASEERLQAIIQSAMDAILTVDARQRIVQFNAAAEQIFHCTAAEAAGADVSRFIRGRPLQQARYGAEFDAAGAPMRKLGQHLALAGVRADGGEFPADASISQVQLQGADLYIVILRDVTERKQIEAALRANEQRYRTLFSKATDGILLLDPQGHVVDANDSFARMHGYAIDEMLETNLRDLDTAQTPTLAAARYARILAGESIGFEVEHYHKDGHVVPMDVVASAIDIDGKQYVLAFHRDISERRRAQQELRGLSKAANEALEAERRRTARELHDELGQMLTALKMDLESLRSALPPARPDLSERTQAMHAMLDATIAATRRIAADLRPLMLDDLGLAAALDWLTHNFSRQTGIATDLVIDDTVAQVPEPIASALYRITQESLTNVTKYAQATATEIRLERDGDWVQLTIRDNGRGLEEADLKKGGTFGLLGIRERVMLLSGEIAVKGEPGNGTEVRARIPLAATQPRETAA